MRFIASTEKWIKLGQPDLNSIIFLRDRSTSERRKFRVDAINYGTKKGIVMKLKRLK